jgi:hypothetical protein
VISFHQKSTNSLFKDFTRFTTFTLFFGYEMWVIVGWVDTKIWLLIEKQDRLEMISRIGRK